MATPNPHVLPHASLDRPGEIVSSATFGLFIYFTIDYFLHFSARIPSYGSLRPTLLLVLIITFTLVMQSQTLKGRLAPYAPAKAMVWLVILVAVTLPLVEWPGSVIKNNLPEFVKAVVFFFFPALILDTEKRLKIFVFVFMGCQLFRSLEPLYLNVTEGYLGSWTHIGSEWAGRLSGAPADVVNPNGLGFVIVTVIPFLYFFLVYQGNSIKTVLFWALAGPLVYALTLTMSRGGMIAFMVVAWMIIKNTQSRLPLLLAASLGLILVWGTLSPMQKDRYLSLFSANTENAASVEGRKEGLKTEFLLGFERPIFGHGLGTTPEAKANLGSNHRAQAAHNMYTELWIELGIAGLIVFLTYIKRLHDLISSEKSRSHRIDQAILGSAFGFEHRLTLTLSAVFWMYVVFSFNYFGVSQYYWYLFGGISLALQRSIQAKIEVLSISKTTQDLRSQQHKSGNCPPRSKSKW